MALTNLLCWRYETLTHIRREKITNGGLTCLCVNGAGKINKDYNSEFAVLRY